MTSVELGERGIAASFAGFSMQLLRLEALDGPSPCGLPVTLGAVGCDSAVGVESECESPQYATFKMPSCRYVPLVLEAQDQLVAVGRAMIDQTAAARELLRAGAFTGLRDNIRAVGEYAVVRWILQLADYL